MKFEKLSERLLEDHKGFLETEIEESSDLEGSLTNDVVITDYNGTVLKRFSKRPAMAVVQMCGRVPSGKVEFPDYRTRMENERSFRDLYDQSFRYEEDILVDVPEILGSEGQFMEFERLEGEKLNLYLEETEGEAEALGRTIGSFTRRIHEEGGAFTDMRINNFLVENETQVGFVDAEYFSRDASYWEKSMDLITMDSSAKQLNREAYRSFMHGFASEYRDTDTTEGAVSSLTSLAHAGLLERDSKRLRNAADNFYSSLKSSATPFMQ